MNKLQNVQLRKYKTAKSSATRYNKSQNDMKKKTKKMQIMHYRDN